MAPPLSPVKGKISDSGRTHIPDCHPVWNLNYHDMLEAPNPRTLKAPLGEWLQRVKLPT